MLIEYAFFRKRLQAPGKLEEAETYKKQELERNQARGKPRNVADNEKEKARNRKKAQKQRVKKRAAAAAAAEGGAGGPLEEAGPGGPLEEAGAR